MSKNFCYLLSITHSGCVALLGLAFCIFGLAASSILQAADSSNPQQHQLLKPLPESLTSFGAMTQGEHLYVFSGHNGEMHSFSRDSLNQKFRRIQFDNPEAQWEELSMDSPAQSVSLVSDGQLIYRIAGLSFNNSAEETQSFRSTDNFAAYDPATNQWNQLTPLPEGRSSMDAAILGRSIYVVGGWNLQGESSSDAHWHKDMLRFDLDNPQAGWQILPGPGYKLRALSVAVLGNRIVALGGMTPRGFTRQVAVYDTASQKWSRGPELLADHAQAGFAASAFAVGGRLYQAGASGILYRLSQDGSSWEVADRLFYPRNFLRLLPAGSERLLAVGGTGAVGRTAAVESINVQLDDSPRAKWISWTVDAQPAKSGQAVCLHQGKLYSFGGALAASSGADSAQQAVSDASEYDLSLHTVRSLPPVPKAVANAVAISHASTSSHGSIFVFAAIDGDASGASQTFVWQLDPTSDRWTQASISMPLQVSGFSAVRHDDAFWILGGGRDKQFNHQIYHWWGDESAVAPLPKVELPNSRRDFGSGLIEHEIYLLGGRNSQGTIVPDIDVFDTKSRTWRKAASPATPRLFPQVASHNGRLFLFGGYTSSDGQLQPDLSLEVYDKQQDHWTTLGESLPKFSADTKLLSLQGRLLFVGADIANQAKTRLAIYYPGLPEQPATVSPMSMAGFVSRNVETPEQGAKGIMRKDTDKDGIVSRAEIGQRMTSFFDSADQDRDGYLTEEEVFSAIKSQKSSESKYGESKGDKGSE